VKIAVEAAEAGTGVESRVTLAETWHAYLRSVAQKLRPGTLESYRGSMHSHVLPALGHVTLAELTPGRIRAFVDAELARGVSPKTVRNSVGVIRSTLAGLVSHGVIRSNPASIARGSLPLPARRPSVLTRTQLREFLEASAGDPFEDLVLFLALTGVRLREALALRWCEVDLEARTAIIRRSVSLRRRHMPTIRLGFRTVDLAGPIVAALARRRAECQAADLVFEGDERGGCLNVRLVHHAFRRAAQRAGIAIVNPHVLRRTWAATLLEAGVPMSYVSRSLGHSSTAVTSAACASAHPTIAAERSSSRPLPPLRLLPAHATTPHSRAL